MYIMYLSRQSGHMVLNELCMFQIIKQKYCVKCLRHEYLKKIKNSFFYHIEYIYTLS